MRFLLAVVTIIQVEQVKQQPHLVVSCPKLSMNFLKFPKGAVRTVALLAKPDTARYCANLRLVLVRIKAEKCVTM